MLFCFAANVLFMINNTRLCCSHNLRFVKPSRILRPFPPFSRISRDITRFVLHQQKCTKSPIVPSVKTCLLSDLSFSQGKCGQHTSRFEACPTRTMSKPIEAMRQPRRSDRITKHPPRLTTQDSRLTIHVHASLMRHDTSA